MSVWLTSLEGTAAGHQLALALIAALLHAVFGALQKGRHDPWLSRGAIDASFGLMATPFAFLVVPWPEPHLWPILGGAFVIHLGYKLAQAFAYTKGAYTVVYPVVRGTGAAVHRDRRLMDIRRGLHGHAVAGRRVLLSGIFGLAIYNLIFLAAARDTLNHALALAFLTGGFVAVYTTWDAYGIRATADPFTFLAWFFFLDGLAMPVIAALRWHRMADRPSPGPLMARGLLGGLIAFGSFGSIMLATRLDKVGEAAVLRETSTVFAALIGRLVLKETVGSRRLAPMALIAAGAVIVEFGG